MNWFKGEYKYMNFYNEIKQKLIDNEIYKK